MAILKKKQSCEFLLLFCSVLIIFWKKFKFSTNQFCGKCVFSVWKPTLQSKDQNKSVAVKAMVQLMALSELFVLISSIVGQSLSYNNSGKSVVKCSNAIIKIYENRVFCGSKWPVSIWFIHHVSELIATSTEQKF